MHIKGVNAISHHLGKSHSSSDNEANEPNEENIGVACVPQSTASNGRNDNSPGTRRSRSAYAEEARVGAGAGAGLADLILGLNAEDNHIDTASTRHILSSSGPRAQRLSHPTNGGTMMALLTDTDGSNSNPRNDSIEGQERAEARAQVHEAMAHEHELRRSEQDVGNNQVENELQVPRNVGSQRQEFHLDDQLFAAAFRGWIDELDIYERKGCRFLKRKRNSV